MKPSKCSLNYDTVVEQFCKSQRIPCADGFSQGGEWQPDLYYRADSGIRLWKLHGSVNWTSSESGWPRRAETPGSWRRHFHSRHTASATAEAALVACGDKTSREVAVSSPLSVSKQTGNVSSARGRRLSFRRRAHPSRVVDSLKVNPRLHVLILCGSRSTFDLAKLTLLLGTSGYESRVDVFEPGRIEEALGRGLLKLETTALLQRPDRSFLWAAAAPRERRARSVMPGIFSALDKAGDNLILSRGNPRTGLFLRAPHR